MVLGLVVALMVSQSEVTAPAVATSAGESELAAAPRAYEPRVGAGALVGRMAMTALFGGLGYASGAGLTAGLVLGAFVFTSSYAGLVFAPLALIIASPVVLGLAIFGVALGAAMFGERFSSDFRDALKVSAVWVPLGTALAAALMLAFVWLSPAVGFFAVPLLVFFGTAVAVPLIVQALKPAPAMLSRRVRPNEAALGGGLTLAF